MIDGWGDQRRWDQPLAWRVQGVNEGELRGGAWVGVAVLVPGARLLIWNLGMISRYSSLSYIHEFINEFIGHEMSHMNS